MKKVVNIITVLATIIALSFGCSIKSGKSNKFRGNNNNSDSTNNDNASSNDQTTTAGDSTNESTNEDQNSQDQQTNNQSNDEIIDIKDLQVALGLRSFEQINETFAALTGISPSTVISGDPNNRTINDFYKELSAQLPTTNDIKAFLASHQVAIAKLAVEYCDALLNDTTKRQNLLPGFNFTAAANQAFDSNGKNIVIDNLVQKFWIENMDKLPFGADVKVVLSAMIDEIIANLSANAITLNILKGTCTAILASAPVTIM